MIGIGRYLPASSAAFAILALSCGKAAFTQAVKDRYGLSSEDLGRMQFFTSEEIVLKREVTIQSKGQRGSSLSIQDGIRIEEVVIPAGTPGVAVVVQPNFILVSFSRKAPGHALWFALTSSGEDGLGSDAKPFGLAALENDVSETGPFTPRWSKGFLVSWGGEKYRISSGRNAYLTYEIDESFAKEKVKQEPPGWRLSEGAPSVKVPPPAPPPPAPSASASAPPSASASAPATPAPTP